MASTRNRNTAIDYKLEQSVNRNILAQTTYIHARRPTTECIPTIGYMPSHMSRDALANNPIDIESTLYGIGATNLVQPCVAVEPSLKPIEFKDFFERRNAVIMPYPLIFNQGQRPTLD